MAPSRALFAHLRSSPRVLPFARRTISSCTQTHRSRISPALHSGITRAFPALPSRRGYATATPEPPDYLNEAELQIFNKIKAELQPVTLEVQDISGGCGSMYALQIESERFKGLSVIKQHKMVNEVLKEEIKGWHGVQLRTKAP
ncbi:bola-like protein [Bimuria novae-zelandiae CBS 107.79]|uniref:Bola-like protein n=1 Tax=Bimuria novae-zelandiae CBS 107.79 TaxID=1447943 RepID=A0A6A5UP69_9PLEO|nr:bola-like protein [Bimuria novae-zelandiae CBS 107.79]